MQVKSESPTRADARVGRRLVRCGPSLQPGELHARLLASLDELTLPLHPLVLELSDPGLLLGRERDHAVESPLEGIGPDDVVAMEVLELSAVRLRVVGVVGVGLDALLLQGELCLCRQPARLIFHMMLGNEHVLVLHHLDLAARELHSVTQVGIVIFPDDGRHQAAADAERTLLFTGIGHDSTFRFLGARTIRTRQEY